MDGSWNFDFEELAVFSAATERGRVMALIDLDAWACKPPANPKRISAMRLNLKGTFMMIWGERLRDVQSPNSASRKRLLVVNHFFSGGSRARFFRDLTSGHRTLLIPLEQRVFQLFYSLSQLFQFFTHARQAPDVRVQSLVFFQWLNRNPPPHAGPDNLPRQHTCL